MTKPKHGQPGKTWEKPQRTQTAPGGPSSKRQPKKLRLTIRPK